MPEFRDLPGRHAIVSIGSRGWIEVWDDDHPDSEGGYRVEHHVPTKAQGGGVEDKPDVLVEHDYKLAVRQLLARTDCDVSEVLGRLEKRWRN